MYDHDSVNVPAYGPRVHSSGVCGIRVGNVEKSCLEGLLVCRINLIPAVAIGNI
jgi:hypothetical protein